MVEVMKIIATSFKMFHAHPSALSIPNHAAGHCQPTPPPEPHRQVWVSVLWRHCSFLLDAHKILFVPSKSLFCQSCVLWWLYSRVNGNLFQDGLCHTQVCLTQRPYSCDRPLLTHTSAGDTQTQFCLSLCGVSGFWCTQDLFEPSKHLWRVWV